MLFRIFSYEVYIFIHGEYYISMIFIPRWLVSNWPCVIPVFYPVIKFDKILTVSRFITHGPHNDAGLIFISFHHSLTPVDPLGLPGRIIGNVTITVLMEPHSMGFNIGFINHIKSVLTTQLVPSLLVGIMGCPNRIYIVLFH